MSPKAPAAPAPLLVRGAHLYPADATDRVVPDGSVLAVDGRVAAVGTVEEVDAAVAALDPATRAALRTLDARRMIALPGFVNAHWHELFATRLPFNGAFRPDSDREDQPGFLGRGGDMYRTSAVFDSFHDMIDGLTPEEGDAIARYSMWTQLRAGVTTLGDVGSVNHPDALADAALGLGMRCSVSTWAADAVCAPGESRFRRTRDTDLLLSRVEALIDRCAADPTGLLRARPTAVYGTNMTDELALGLAGLVERHDTGFASHICAQRNEPEVIRTYYGSTPVRRFADLGLLNERLMSVHTAFVDDEERKLLLEGRVHLSHSPGKYGGAGESAMTETRVIPDLRRAGLDVSLSTDGQPLSFAGMPEQMRAAWQVHNELYADSTVVVPTDALAMATRLAARGLRWEDRIGSLEPGKEADLVLVPMDDWRYVHNPRPLEAFLALGGSGDVDTVVVGGRVLIEGGRGVAADEAELLAGYEEAVRSFSIRCLKVDPDRIDALYARSARRRGGDGTPTSEAGAR
ncbi:putative amidohydrolase [Actinacidiphila reveromycinica]|uniref:Putative amidohydrolase n=1 Tax=Actinacidiphila reveromycinica TaxID=659352 RepID=A0A7U3UWN1_9ACTN|nr:amidohydrolase family protein [Streptomyces sp. SN-593]BBB00125.1 putative amidohydrolase [Streptomyces sp. SN-593]